MIDPGAPGLESSPRPEAPPAHSSYGMRSTRFFVVHDRSRRLVTGDGPAVEPVEPEAVRMVREPRPAAEPVGLGDRFLR
jgi:hypothetical protein